MSNPLNPLKKMSKFTAPADHLVHETTGYVNAQIDNVKLRSVKGLSQGTSAVAGFLLIFIIAGTFVTALSAAIVLWLGALLNNYVQAAFIVAGFYLLVLVMLILLRKHLFKNSFINMYADVFFQKENKPDGLKSQETLDMAIWHTQTRVKEKEADITEAFTRLKEYYTPKRLLSDGINNLSKVVPAAIHSFFGKKKKKKE